MTKKKAYKEHRGRKLGEDKYPPFKVLLDRTTGKERDDFLYLFNKEHGWRSPEAPAPAYGNGVGGTPSIVAGGRNTQKGSGIFGGNSDNR